jgi:hypothetical protein
VHERTRPEAEEIGAHGSVDPIRQLYFKLEL